MLPMILQFIKAALGIWLMAAPAVLGYGNPAETNDRIVGPIVAALAFIAGDAVLRGLRWGVLPLGVWEIIAPWIFGFETVALVNAVIVGLLLTVLAPLGGKTNKRYGGGWSSLLPGRQPAWPDDHSNDKSPAS